jgi:hypothetical protein
MTSDTSTPNNATPKASGAGDSSSGNRPGGGPARKRPLARSYEPLAAPTLLDSREAADALRCSVEALRARCRRAAVKDADGNVSAPLAPGVVAVKFGRSTWRVRFDQPKAASRVGAR